MILPRLRGLSTADPSERLILKEVAKAGGSFQTVVFTHNRRVMVSVGDGGRVLRLHESFRAAPTAVLRAVGVLLAGPHRGRRRARKVIGDFIAARPARPPIPRTRRMPPADRPHIVRLQAEFDLVNAEHFAGTLPRVPIYLSGRMRRRNGHFCVTPLEIVISRRLCEQAEEGEAAATLRHEMIHLWQHMQGNRPGHGRDFRQWARRLEVHPRATRVVGWRNEEVNG